MYYVEYCIESQKQNGCKCFSLPSWPRGYLGAAALVTAAQHHERVLYYISLAQEKIKIQKFEVEFLVNAYCFHTIVELNNCKLNHCKLETYL